MVDLVSGQEASHTVAEGLNITHRFHCDFSNLNDSGISSFHHFIVPALRPSNNNRFARGCRLSCMQTTLNGRVHPRLLKLNSDLLLVLFMCLIFMSFLVKQFYLHLFV